MRLSGGDTWLSEEVVQTTFMRLWEHWDGLNDRQAALGYLFSTAKHIFLNYCEHEMVKYVYEEYVMQHGSEATSEPESRQEARSLEEYFKQIIANMPPVRQRVFTMSRYEGKRHAEIASELVIAVNTVECHMSAALGRLRSKLKVS